MDYREQLKNPASLRYIDKLVRDIYEQPEDFAVLYRLIFDEDKNVAWRAAWAVEKISEKHVNWFSEENFLELVNLILIKNHGGIQRGCLSMLLNLPLPNQIPVEFINFCFDSMISPKSPIAVQALSMKMLLRITQKEPDFRQELIAYLENIDFESYSAGFKSTRRNVLKALNNK